MIRLGRRSVSCFRRRAMTLIEVLAALVLLGGVIVTVLVAQSRSLTQQTAAERQRRATQLAENLLVRWRLEGIATIEPDRGSFEHEAGWCWQRDVRRRVLLGDLEMKEVVLTILKAGPDHGDEELLQLTWLEPFSPLRKEPL